MKKLVVITGASSGFGKAMAQSFSKAGHPLLLLGRRLEKMQALHLDNCLCRKVDVTDYACFESAVKEAEEVFGPTDLLVNNAGVMLLGALQSQDPTEWQTMLNVNVMGVMNGMKIVTPGMMERKGGTIINLSSVAGKQPFGNHAAYCASKYGVTGLTSVARGELSPYNVRVLSICPGAVQTELLSHTTDPNIIEGYNDWRDGLGANSISPQDVANTIKFAYDLPQGVSLREIIITDTLQDA
jgi:NADP-dependent 3-hydroxy acid dehydrogenase YdfG